MSESDAGGGAGAGTGDASGPGMGGNDNGQNGANNDANEGGNDGSGNGGDSPWGPGTYGQQNPWGPPPAWWGQAPPAFTPQLNAQPVYTQPQAPMFPAATQGTTPGGFLPGLEQMRTLFGPRPLQGRPQAPMGGPAPGQGTPMGVWSPPPVAPVQYPQETILNGQGGNAAYYDQMQRLAPSQTPRMGFFDTLAQYRRW